jgi:uncharacterized protein YjaZ
MTRRAAPAVLVWLAMAGCDGSSPTAPNAPPPSATIVFVDAPALAAHEAAITSLLLGAVERARSRLPVGAVRFAVSAQRTRVIPGWGLGGYTTGPNAVDIFVDGAVPALEAILAERLPPLAAHEIHHTVRWQLRGYSWGTLLEAMVTEGLADHFAIELMGSPLPPWCTALPESEIEAYLDLARAELDDPGFDYDAWFFGTGSRLPRWTGYTLGYRLVADYLGRHPGASAASLVGVPAEAFRPG